MNPLRANQRSPTAQTLQGASSFHLLLQSRCQILPLAGACTTFRPLAERSFGAWPCSCTFHRWPRSPLQIWRSVDSPSCCTRHPQNARGASCVSHRFARTPTELFCCVALKTRQSHLNHLHERQCMCNRRASTHGHSFADTRTAHRRRSQEPKTRLSERSIRLTALLEAQKARNLITSSAKNTERRTPVRLRQSTAMFPIRSPSSHHAHASPRPSARIPITPVAPGRRHHVR